MYLPSHFEESDPQALHALIGTIRWACWSATAKRAWTPTTCRSS